MKLLLYNWAQFDNESRLGGGVSIYLQRLIPVLVAKGVEVVFVSVGSDASQKIRVEASKNGFASIGVASYVLYNPEVPYPHRRAFASNTVFEGFDTLAVLSEFIRQQKPDVVNFHSLEGLPPSVLRLKKTFPQTKWWFTAHNYHLVCQQIQLFQTRYNRNCDDFLAGHACQTCQWQDFDSIATKELLIHRAPKLRSLLSLMWTASKFFRYLDVAKKWRDNNSKSNIVDQSWLTRDVLQGSDYFVKWREYNSITAAEFLDGVVSVSNMQKQQLLDAGIRAKRMPVLSPSVSDKTPVHRVANSSSKISNISYWGYSNPGTGLSLFLDALELVAHLVDTEEVGVLIVSDIGRRFRDRLGLLAKRFKSIEVVSTYEHSEMPAIAGKSDLAVLGPILRETYCQVAAELYSLSVPVLASSTLGFAGEHINDERFIFESGEASSLSAKLVDLINNPISLTNYWSTTTAPIDLARHVEDLLMLYDFNSAYRISDL